MFIRYSLGATAEEIAKRFNVDVLDGYNPNYNAAPTHLLPVVTQESQQGLSFFYWGAAPQWANKKPLAEKIINTSVERMSEKQVVRKKLREKRCLIPADGFYEWKRTGKRTNIPYRFTLREKSLFALAGLWEEYDDEDGNMFHTFTVITTTANESVLPIAERMPVILNQELEKSWLDATNEAELIFMLQACSHVLSYYTVSPLVNTPERNDPMVILPAPAADQFGNLTLFD